jgi:hypothetical protein
MVADCAAARRLAESRERPENKYFHFQVIWKYNMLSGCCSTLLRPHFHG